MSGRRSSMARVWVSAVVVVVLQNALAFAALEGVRARGTTLGALTPLLADLGRVAVLAGAVPSGQVQGTDLVDPAQFPDLARALRGSDASALAGAADAAGVNAMLVLDPRRDDKASRLDARFRALGFVPGFRGRRLSSSYGLYVREEEVELDAALGRGLALTARRILSGSHPPLVRSFAEPIRRARSAEVLVVIRERGVPKLWRSARSSSIAQGLLTATIAARDRWAEREEAMGGPLARALGRLDIEVSLLEEDGTYDVRTPAFLDWAVSSEHGIAYDRKGVWRYFLPEQTRARRTPSEALRDLFREFGVPETSIERADLRLYRVVALRLGISLAVDATLAPSEGEPGSTAPSVDVAGGR